MLGNEPVLAPDETFYQRLLAMTRRRQSIKPKSSWRSGLSPNCLTTLRSLPW
jgi:hypothetical protein